MMKEVWLEVKRLRQILGIKERAIRWRIRQGKYRTKSVKGKGRAGLRWLVALSSLPADSQLSYYMSEATAMPRQKSGEATATLPWVENKGVSDDLWLSVRELAAVAKIAERTVRWRISKGVYSKVREVNQKGYGQGTVYEVHVSCLPRKVQERIRGVEDSRVQGESQHEDIPDSVGTGLHSTWGNEKCKMKIENLAGAGGRAQRVALARFVLVQGFEEFKDSEDSHTGHRAHGENISETNRLRDYLNTYYRRGQGVEGLREVLGDSISLNTFYRWRKLYNEQGIAGLVNRHRGGTGTLSEAEQEKLKEIWGVKTKPSMQFAYRAYMRWCGERKKKPKDYDVCRRFLKSLPEGWAVLHREGEKEYRQRIAPYLEMDMGNCLSNQWWSSDHKQLDINVLIDGVERKFAWLTVWIDEPSRKIMGWVIDKQWSGETILGSFRDAVLKYGVPQHVRIDRGKDYRSIRVQGLLGELGVTVHYCIPYRPQSKGKVERLFRFIDDDFSKYFRANRGRSPKHRREDFQEIVKDEKSLATIVELDEMFATWAEWYNNRKHKGLKGRTPNEVYQEKLVNVRKVDPRHLDLMMMVAHEKLVGRNGVRMFNTWYMGEGLSLYFRKKVQVRYDLHNIDEVLVYDERGKFVCRARRWKAVDASTTSEAEYKEARRVTKRELELLKEADSIKRDGKFMLKPLERLDEEIKEQIEDISHRGHREEEVDIPLEVPEVVEQQREAQYQDRLELVGKYHETLDISHGEHGDQSQHEDMLHSIEGKGEELKLVSDEERELWRRNEED